MSDRTRICEYIMIIATRLSLVTKEVNFFKCFFLQVLQTVRLVPPFWKHVNTYLPACKNNTNLTELKAACFRTE